MKTTKQILNYIGIGFFSLLFFGLFFSMFTGVNASERQYIELGELKAMQVELSTTNTALRAEIERNSTLWHDLDNDIATIEAELFTLSQ